MLVHQLPILQWTNRHQLPKSVPEYERVVPVVEPELELIEIAVKVLTRHLVERTGDTAIEERPCALDGVRVTVTALVAITPLPCRVNALGIHAAGC